MQTIQTASMEMCDEVFSLYRQESGTLGFMPRGGFEDGISNKRLIVAKSKEGRIYGYLLFRVVGRRVIIVHLCVSKSARGKGVALQLVNNLKDTTKHLESISLKCREDFKADKLWQKFGFVAKGSKIGRGADGAKLTIWHYDHGHPDLFSSPPTKIRAAIDSNVFFDLWIRDRAHYEVSACLAEPWVDEVVELVVTQEIYNDINRCPSAETKRKSQEMVNSFYMLRPLALEVDALVPQLLRLYPADGLMNPRDESDVRHLANTIAANVEYFITRDEAVLDKAVELLNDHNVHVFKPSEFISHLDSIFRESEYRPLRIDGSSIHKARLTAERLPTILETYTKPKDSNRTELRLKLERLISNPRKFKMIESTTKDGQPLALTTQTLAPSVQREIVVLRHTPHKLAPTIVRHFLMDAVRQASKDGYGVLRITETLLTPESQAALAEIGFMKDGDTWVKPLLHGLLDLPRIKNTLRGLNLELAPSVEFDKDAIESVIWPAFLDDESIPCYLIPIRAEWAEHFFDIDLAVQRFPSISGIRDDLHLGVEAVYFSATNVNLKAPARIIWYVSKGSEGIGSMSIKAVSRLREATEDTAKALFRKYRRLGVYTWENILACASNDPNKILLGLKFSHTQRFAAPLSLKTLTEFGLQPPFPGPRPVPTDLFRRIIKHGMELLR